MTKRMLIDAQHPEETRVVVLDADRIQDFDFTTVSKLQIKGNIYLAKVTRVEPSLQAAFIEYGGGKQGFLPFAEIHPDYYQIPVSDRQRLMEEDLSDEPLPSQALRPGDLTPMTEAEVNEAEAILFAEANTPEAESVDAGPDSAPYASLVHLLRSGPLRESSELSPVVEGDNEAPAFNETVAADNAPDSTQAESFEAQAEAIAAAQSAPALYDATTYDATTYDAPAHESAPPEVEHDQAEPEHAEDQQVETLDDEAEDDLHEKRKQSLIRRYRIQEVIKRGQIMLVQVIKEERGNKGVSLTTYISLAGRYCVLMPNSTKGGGISRKIAGGEHRSRLRDLVRELSGSEGMSIIVRTAGMDRSVTDIRRDYDYLVRLWNQIRGTVMESVAPAQIYEEGDIIKRAIRDMYTSDIDEILVAGDAAYKEARDFVDMIMPGAEGRVVCYAETTPLFHRYGVEDKLSGMMDPNVRLRSGGSIVINPTEALISIDVNSGRATSERNIEETAKKTNLEAAEEIARQLRLRDLAGLIVIDFIDMMESRNRRAVERALKDALRADRAKIQLGRISPFGLLEMSRQRLRPSISEASMVQCPHCAGRGFLRADNTVAMQILRSVQHEVALGACDEIRVSTSMQVALYMLNHYRAALGELEAKHGVPIVVMVNDRLGADGHQIERIGGAPISRQQRAAVSEDVRRGRSKSRRRDEDGPSSGEDRGNIEEVGGNPRIRGWRTRAPPPWPRPRRAFRPRRTFRKRRTPRAARASRTPGPRRTSGHRRRHKPCRRRRRAQDAPPPGWPQPPWPRRRRRRRIAGGRWRLARKRSLQRYR